MYVPTPPHIFNTVRSSPTMQMVEGQYVCIRRPDTRPSPSSSFQMPQSTGQEIFLETVKMLTPRKHILENMRLVAVYVREDTNDLVYHSEMMVKGRKYPVTWYGEHFILLKDDDGVHVYRFEAD